MAFVSFPTSQHFVLVPTEDLGHWRECTQAVINNGKMRRGWMYYRNFVFNSMTMQLYWSHYK